MIIEHTRWDDFRLERSGHAWRAVPVRADVHWCPRCGRPCGVGWWTLPRWELYLSAVGDVMLLATLAWLVL
jgi:hypothetical protein